MPYFISEVSSNHAKDIKRCLRFVDMSAEVGFDAVKFQLFKIKDLFSKEALSSKPELIDRQEWELPEEFIPIIKKRCDAKDIQFGCTPFYMDAVDYLNDYVDFYKIASYELLWDDLIKKCSSTNKNLIMSTGMASLDEVMHAVTIAKDFSDTLPSLMHCNSTYPMPLDQANLSAIKTIRDASGCNVGWSDHSVSSELVLHSIIEWDASHIELHIDLEGDGGEFDTGHCWLPDQAERLINYVKKIDLINGSGIKKVSEAELFESTWRADPSDGLRPLKKTRYEIEK